MNRQAGFTLLELVIVMAIWALLGLASWRLFDGVVRVQKTASAHEQAFRNVQRAMAMIGRDVVHITRQPIVLDQSRLSLQRSYWRNPLDQPRSERQTLTYRLEGGSLWRDSQAEGAQIVVRQKLLDEVRDLSWRLFDGESGWHAGGSDITRVSTPLGLEVQLSVGRYEALRRVLLLPEVLP
jgi:general secretion pathway protein J